MQNDASLSICPLAPASRGETANQRSVRDRLGMKLTTLEDLLRYQIADLHSAEQQLLHALPIMAKAAKSDDLREAFEQHLRQTRGHVERLVKIAAILGQEIEGRCCQAMESLIEESADLIAEEGDDAVRDVALIGAAQRVEHYEIAGYGTARTLALQLGRHQIARLLEETLAEEQVTDEKLTDLAESGVVLEALDAGAE